MPGSRIEDVIQRGTRAAQPAATAVGTGTLYYVTDESVTERSNGTTWDDCSDAAGAAAHASSHQNGGGDEISIAGLAGVSAELSAHLVDAADAHDASAISFAPAGTIAATTVQAAIEEVAAEAGGGGMTAQDKIDLAWDKQFFVDAALLPATERIAASLVTVPTETGTVQGTLAKDLGRALHTGAVAKTYWDLGALRSTVLVVAGGVTLNSVGADECSLALSPGVPTTGDFDTYLFQVYGNVGYRIVEYSGGSYTVLGSVAASLPPVFGMPTGLALYYGDSSGALKGFVRVAGTWFLAASATDSSLTTMRYVTFKSTNTARLILPFTAWSN